VGAIVPVMRARGNYTLAKRSERLIYSRLSEKPKPPAVSDPVHVVCDHCDSVVRVPPERLGDEPRCPKCRNALIEAHPIELKTANFDRHLTRNDLPVVVDFWAPWCGPCRVMAPAYEEASRRLGTQARFAKVNSDDEPTLSARYGIRGIPTLIVFRGGREVARESGAMDLGSLQRWLGGVLN
jgi:thioredoxin 2